MTEKALSVALVRGGTPLDDDVLAEMLEHLGVPFETLTDQVPRPTLSGRLPVSLISHGSSDAVSRARQVIGDQEGVIVADEAADVSQVGKLLRGERDNRKDNFGLEVNVEERKLLEAIAEKMHDRDLPLVLKSNWPGGAKAACVLTHDVDWLSFSPFHKVVLKGLKHKPSRIPGLVYGGALRGRNFGWNIPETIELEKRFGCRSTFLLMTKYNEARSLLDESMRLMNANGCEIALHGSELCHLSVEALKAEMEQFKATVGRYPRGVRNHILKFKAPHTWEYESDVGLEYDATFGYNRYFGFRGGTCLPYHPFGERGRFPVIELPTGFMDWTALHRRRDASKFGIYLERARKGVEEFNGVLVVNFHNTYLNRHTFPSILSEYEALLKKITEERYWVATAAECAVWWRTRGSTRINPRLAESGAVLIDHGEDVHVHTYDEKDKGRLRGLATSKINVGVTKPHGP